jgi:uncharacterized protein
VRPVRSPALSMQVADLPAISSGALAAVHCQSIVAAVPPHRREAAPAGPRAISGLASRHVVCDLLALSTSRTLGISCRLSLLVAHRATEEGKVRVDGRAERGRYTMHGGRIVIGVSAMVAVVLVLIALAWLFQRRLIYLPTPGRVPPAPIVLHAGEDVAFDTADGLRLGAWFVPAATGHSQATVLVLGGNAGNRAARAPLAAELLRAGLSVLLVDYRGYGGNPGSPSEPGLLADARGARAYLAARGDVDPARLVYFGESLGAAVAVRLAVERPPMALVLRSPFTSLADVGRVHYPLLPVGLLLRDRYASIEQVGGLRCPVLVLAGAGDGIVPWEQSRRLAEAIAGPKRLVLIPGADHNDLELLAGRRLIGEVARFVVDTGRPAGRADR